MRDNFDAIAEAGLIDRHEDRCPTCGRFVPGTESDNEKYFLDLPPGGFQSHDYIVAYCSPVCAEGKSPRAHYEDDEDWEEACAARFPHG